MLATAPAWTSEELAEVKKNTRKKSSHSPLTLFPPPTNATWHTRSLLNLSVPLAPYPPAPPHPPAANNNNKLVQFTRVVFLIVIVENLCVLVLHTRQKILDNTFSPLTSRICCSRERRTI